MGRAVGRHDRCLRGPTHRAACRRRAVVRTTAVVAHGSSHRPWRCRHLGLASASAADSSSPPEVTQRLTITLPDGARFGSGLAFRKTVPATGVCQPGPGRSPRASPREGHGRVRSPSHRGHRRRGFAVLLSGRPVDWIFSDGLLKRVSLGDNLVTTICKVPEGIGAQGT